MNLSKMAVAGRCNERGGFTLIELMVVISILVVVAGLAAGAFHAMFKGKEVQEAAQAIQAAFMTARDMAMKTGKPVGVRFIRKESGGDRSLISGLLIVQDSSSTTQGTAHVLRPNLIGWNPNMDENGNWQPSFDNGLSKYWQYTGGNKERRYKTISEFWKGGSRWYKDKNGQENDTYIPPCLVRRGLYYVERSYVGTTPWLFRKSAIENAGQIRFEDSGPFYDFARINAFTLWLTSDTPAVPIYNPAIFLNNPNNENRDDDYEGVRFEIRRNGRVTLPVPGVDPILLPDGVAIDLGQIPGRRRTRSSQGAAWKYYRPDPPRNRLSRILPDPQNRGWISGWRWEIMFSPDRHVLSPQARLSKVVLWIREEDEPVERNPNDPLRRKMLHRSALDYNHALVTVETSTGDVSTSRPVLIFKTDDEDRIIPGQDYYDFDSYFLKVDRGERSGL